MAPIEEIEVIPLRVGGSDVDDCDGTVDTVVVKLTDSEGRSGIGESDASPEAVRAFLETPTAHIWARRASEILIGQDPLEITALWERLYEGTIYSGRRGLGIHALSAIDLALHDLAGKQVGVPAYKLMGGARRETLRPYCTIFPGLPKDRSLSELLEITGKQFEQALSLGFRAVKMEVMYFDLVTDAQLVEAIREGRRMLGDGITMMLDFGYRWRDWHDAYWVLRRVEDCNIYFAEATLQHDDLRGHARLAELSPIRICGAEMAATRWEIREWIETGKVAVVQPDISRCGGLTEIRRIADFCELHGVQVIPHGWKTGILAAAGRHFQAACPNAPYFEFISPHVYQSPLREKLVQPEPFVTDGQMSLPEGPGLGVELDEEIVRTYRVANA
ncbi:MAG: mandelate racemase/muconate lactonizing enzyme family protein [Rhizobiales bacterium]|nr:mandelate racemase/muconate lactonizing enzyme family protein [Hyphomicrobiales bacterium]